LLSAEHETLPFSELKACLEISGGKFCIKDKVKNVVIFESNAPNISKILAERMSMAHIICKFLFKCEADERAIIRNIRDHLLEFEGFRDFYIEKHKIFGAKGVKGVSKRLGRYIEEKCKVRANFRNPEAILDIIFIDNFCYAGLRLSKVKKDFYKRDLKKRPVNYPGALKPKLARLFVNLARTKANELMLDPFCGLGSILIEANVLGAKCIGVDINSKMLKGAKTNLKHYAKHAILIKGDARDVAKFIDAEVDAVATDPPYGISSSTHRIPQESLYCETLEELSKLLKRNRYIAFATSHHTNLEDLLPGNLELLEKHAQYVHKNLTRIIYVIEKT